MGQWIACGSGFIEADVIRWKEAVWERRGPRQGRAVKIGDRVVIAEVLRDADEEGWVYLLIRGCEVFPGKTEKKIEALPKGKEVKRKRATVARGKPERLLWSDEGARALLASRFLGNRKPVSLAPDDAGEN